MSRVVRELVDDVTAEDAAMVSQCGLGWAVCAALVLLEVWAPTGCVRRSGRWPRRTWRHDDPRAVASHLFEHRRAASLLRWHGWSERVEAGKARVSLVSSSRQAQSALGPGSSFHPALEAGYESGPATVEPLSAEAPSAHAPSHRQRHDAGSGQLCSSSHQRRARACARPLCARAPRPLGRSRTQMETLHASSCLG